jgi:hypothetical protein
LFKLKRGAAIAAALTIWIGTAASAQEAAAAADATASPDVAALSTEPAPDETAQPVADATVLTNWVIATRDNGDRPFMVIDKMSAELFVYDSNGQPLGHAPVLLGIAKGDDSTPEVGNRELSHIPVKDRTTPAGRFIAKMGPATGHKQVLWVDYGSAISLHPVITSNAREHRLRRLQSPTAGDNRITFGCINVPRDFYKSVVEPLFPDKSATGVVYVLPDTKPVNEVFASVPFPVSLATAD